MVFVILTLDQTEKTSTEQQQQKDNNIEVKMCM